MNKDSPPTVPLMDSSPPNGEGTKSSPPNNVPNTPGSSPPDSNLSNILKSILSNSSSSNDDSRRSSNSDIQTLSSISLNPTAVQQVLQSLQNGMFNTTNSDRDKRVSSSTVNPVETARMLLTMSRNNSSTPTTPGSASGTPAAPSDSQNASDSERSTTTRKQAKHDKRRRVTKACVHCQRSHMSCDSERPCKRCVERGISELCTDGETKRRGRKRVYLQDNEVASTTPSSSQIDLLSQQLSMFQPPTQQPPFVSPEALQAVLAQVPTKEKQAILKRQKVDDVNFMEFSNAIFQNFNSPNSVSPPNSNSPPNSAPTPAPNTQPTSDWESLNLDLSHMREQRAFLSKYSDQDVQLESPSTTTNLHFAQGFCDALRRRLAVDDSEMISKKLMTIRSQILALKQNLKPETVDLTKRDFDMYLGVFRNTFEQLAIPTLIWERLGVIHFANSAYQQLTGFRGKTPTEPDGFVLLVEFSAIAVRHYMSRLLTVFMETSVNSFMFPAGVLAHDISKPEHLIYIEGTMCVTIKRDIIGLPLLFIGNFLPRSV